MDRVKHLTIPLFLFSLLLVALPLVELAGAVWPVGSGSAEWRFGAVGLLSNALLQPLLGSFIMVLVAAHGEKRELLWVLGVLNALAALVLLVVLPIFVLDSLELRSRVPDAARLAFDVAALRAFFVNGFAAVVLATLSRGGFKSSRDVDQPLKESPKDASPVIVWDRMD